MNPHRSTLAPLLALLGWVALVAGCGAPAPHVSRPGAARDACADRLHDVSGQLLLCYAATGRLPPSLEDLRTARGTAQNPPLVCPVSGKPYLYRPEGLLLPGQPGRLVLYDAAGAHAGMRWGIVIAAGEPGASLTASVIPVDEALMSE